MMYLSDEDKESKDMLFCVYAKHKDFAKNKMYGNHKKEEILKFLSMRKLKTDLFKSCN